MKYLLHIDTSADRSTVAIGGDGRLLASRTNEEARNHASAINNMINDVVKDAGITLSAIDAIVVCAGPGSYTGLRIGLATAKGLCYALDKPLLLDNRLTLLAYQLYKQNAGGVSNYLSLLIAREKEYFVSIYDADFNCVLLPQHVNEDELKQLLTTENEIQIITNVSEDIFNRLTFNYLNINKDTNAYLSSWLVRGFEEYKYSHFVNLATAEPFYLKQVYTHK